VNKLIIVLAVALFSIFIFTSAAFCQSTFSLEEGIQQYREENFEEAIEILTKVREQDPKSSAAAFFLGLAYKQVMDHQNASVHLEAAVTMTPKIKEALVELIDSLYQTDKIAEAKKWVEVAEKEKISPAKVAFLKGLILSKENMNQEAIVEFEKSKKLDTSFSQSADFQIALCYMKDRKLDKAKERLQLTVTHDPLSDLAAYARQYQDMVEKRIYSERPLRLTIGIMGGYDTNMLSKPTSEAAATGVTGEKAYVLNSSVRLDYAPTFDGPLLFNAGYAFASSVHSKNTHSNDSMANTFHILPGYNFGRFTLNLYASYTDVLLRTDPDIAPDPDSNPSYKRYMDYITYGPMLRFLLTQNSILELFYGYDTKAYYNTKKTSTRTDPFYENNRDSLGPRAYASWIWIFRENTFLNLRYEFNQEHTDGVWWENEGHRLTANLSIPILSEDRAKRIGQVKLQLTGSAFLQDYKYNQTFNDEDGVSKTEQRKDRTYTGSIGFSWDFWTYATFIAQFEKTRATSNMPIYGYDRDLYTAGFEFRF
jgi:tetratricopeptide (TPR) repeat protein